ncbi:polyprenyl synthetase family protein [Mycobacterium sp. NPDC006124]|uniref:polyprenyl synthetase family protein n=1 Tax=Mycobacterium sp. NPDC006124 TaxID=3156729 RepID=UPI0033ADD6F8
MTGDDHEAPGVVLSHRRHRGHRGRSPVRAVQGSADVRAAVRGLLVDFVTTECLPQLDGTGVDVASGVLSDFLDGGKYVRSTFMYLGWLCGAEQDEAALRASASLELLHAFALLQDDVMDESTLRRGRPAAHVALSAWHRGRGLTDSSDRFGESAATILGDLCLVWAEKMLRQSGVSAEALARIWPRYDEMRVELAVGQLADLVNDSHAFPTFEEVLDVARRKSGNYTVRRPLEIGAAMAGCREAVVDAVGRYGTAIGEAFQLRDDLLGISGSPTVTGKSVGTDLEAQKATSVVVAAHQMADAGLRRQLADLMTTPTLTTEDAERWRTLIIASGAIQWIEELIEQRLAQAIGYLDVAGIPQDARAAMEDMAVYCTERSA